jgi:hypothetical protein
MWLPRRGLGARAALAYPARGCVYFVVCIRTLFHRAPLPGNEAGPLTCGNCAVRQPRFKRGCRTWAGVGRPRAHPPVPGRHLRPAPAGWTRSPVTSAPGPPTGRRRLGIGTPAMPSSRSPARATRASRPPARPGCYTGPDTTPATACHYPGITGAPLIPPHQRPAGHPVPPHQRPAGHPVPPHQPPAGRPAQRHRIVAGRAPAHSRPRQEPSQQSVSVARILSETMRSTRETQETAGRCTAGQALRIEPSDGLASLARGTIPVRSAAPLGVTRLAGYEAAESSRNPGAIDMSGRTCSPGARVRSAWATRPGHARHPR